MKAVAQAQLDPLALAAEISRLEPGAQLSAAHVEWISSGLRRFLRGDGTLEDCLFLNGAARVRARNRALLKAAEILDDGRGIRPNPLAGMLERAISRFENLYPPHRREQKHVDGMTPLNLAIYQAFTSGARALKSQRKLHDLLR